MVIMFITINGSILKLGLVTLSIYAEQPSDFYFYDLMSDFFACLYLNRI